MDVHKTVKDSRLFRGLSDDQVESIVADSKAKSLSEGSSLMLQGLVGDDLHIIQTGELLIYAGAKTLISKLGPGDCVGEMSLIEPKRDRSASVVAGPQTTTISVRKFTLERLMGSDKDAAALIYKNIAQILCERVRSLNRKLAGE